MIVHFNHQSLEQQFVQALEALCRTQPEAAERPAWERAMRLYGGYLKAIASAPRPTACCPPGCTGPTKRRMRKRSAGCTWQRDYEAEKRNYEEQLAQGSPVAPGWPCCGISRCGFSFRGNTAVMLAMARRPRCGALLRRRGTAAAGGGAAVLDVGQNPFGQSLIYGAGSNYCRQYAVLCGECAGEVPVGVETLGNEDVPYWPQNNNATFREVWVGAACRWLWLCADYLGE